MLTCEDCHLFKETSRIAPQLLLRNLLDTFTVPTAGTYAAKHVIYFLAEDIEDALQISLAVASKVDYIPTNLVSGFAKSPTLVLSSKDLPLMVASGD